ncbi:MAG: hypothetical protein ABUT20_25470 [Bacteroidota bacterium]
MIPEPYEFTVVVKNDIPERFTGTAMADLFGYTPVFIKDNTGLKIQWQLFYSILEGKSGNKLFEFKTATNFIIPAGIEDEDFFTTAYGHLLASINGFNWHFERNKSFLTMGKRYSPLPLLNEIKPLTRVAYESSDVFS